LNPLDTIVRPPRCLANNVPKSPGWTPLLSGEKAPVQSPSDSDISKRTGSRERASGEDLDEVIFREEGIDCPILLTTPLEKLRTEKSFIYSRARTRRISRPRFCKSELTERVLFF
jgi:hypothetical protein